VKSPSGFAAPLKDPEYAPVVSSAGDLVLDIKVV
jgi:hypothetical protein